MSPERGGPSEEDQAGEAPAPRLTEGRRDILRMTALGVPIEGIAAEKHIALQSVYNELDRIKNKLKAANKFHAVLIAIRTGELSPEEVMSEPVIELLPSLLPSQREVLNAMRVQEGRSWESISVAQRTGYNLRQVENHRLGIGRKLKTSILPAVLNFHLVTPEWPVTWKDRSSRRKLE